MLFGVPPPFMLFSQIMIASCFRVVVCCIGREEGELRAFSEAHFLVRYLLLSMEF